MLKIIDNGSALPNNWRLRLPDFNSHRSDGELDSDHGADEDGLVNKRHSLQVSFEMAAINVQPARVHPCTVNQRETIRLSASCRAVGPERLWVPINLMTRLPHLNGPAASA
jgi:hypothetical protein